MDHSCSDTRKACGTLQVYISEGKYSIREVILNSYKYQVVFNKINPKWREIKLTWFCDKSFSLNDVVGFKPLDLLL